MQQLKAAMASIPKDLEAAYRQAFDAIDENNTMYVSKIMMWLAVSLQPLDTNQIAAIVGFRDSDYVLQICSTLLVTIIDEDTTKIIKLAHFSVKEFLVIHLQEKSTHWYRFTTESANSNVASLALDALLYSDHQLKPILAYAAQHWPRHATDGLRAESHTELEEKICLLLDDASGGRLHDWLAIHDPDNVHGHQNHRRPGALYYASLLGFEAAVSKICGSSPQSLRNEGKHENALNAAAILGNVAVVRWMLRNCPGSSESLDIVRVAGEINANVTECFVELLSGPAHLVITEEVVEAAAENEGRGQEVMKALLDRQGNEFQITERVLRAAAGNWDSGQQVMALLLKRRADEVLITEEVVKTAFGNQYSGQQVMRAIFEHKGSEVQMTENVIKAAIESGQSGQEVMELLLERRREGSELQITEQITCLIAGNFNASTMRLLLERRGDEVHVTEAVVKAAAGSYLYAQQVMEVLLERRKDQVQLTEEVVQAAAGNKMSGKQALKAILEKKAKRDQITESVVKLIAGKFDADTTELLLRKSGDDLKLTEEVFEAVMSNEYHAQGVMEVLLQWKPDCCDQITEPLAKAAATNSRSGRQVMELLLANKEHPVSITESAFITICCHWNREDMMELVSERLGADSLTSRLESAIILRNTAAVQALLKRGTDPNKWTHRDRPLFLAESYGNTRLFELLLLHGAQLTSIQKEGSSMYNTIERGFTGIVKLLLENGADPQKADALGRTPLNAAISKRSVAIVQLLLEHGADPMMADGNTWMPLLFAIDIKSATIVQILLEHGADPQQAGTDKCTPLTAAITAESIDIVQLLLERGADPTGDALTAAINEEATPIVEMLLRHGADPTFRDEAGVTHLHYASSQGLIDIVKLLLKSGANPSALDDDGETALAYAWMCEKIDIVKLFLEHGTDINIKMENGVTMLGSASFHGMAEVVNELLARGADPTIADVNGDTPLHLASLEGHIEVVRSLDEQQRGLQILNRWGETALDCAVQAGHSDIVDLLRQRSQSTTTRDTSIDIMVGHELAKRGPGSVYRDAPSTTGKPLHRHVIRGAFNKLKTYWSAS